MVLGQAAQKITMKNNSNADVKFWCQFHNDGIVVPPGGAVAQDWAWNWGFGKPDVTVSFIINGKTYSLLVIEGETLTVEPDGTFHTN